MSYAIGYFVKTIRVFYRFHLYNVDIIIISDYSLVLLIHAGELSNTNTYQVRSLKSNIVVFTPMLQGFLAYQA